MKRIRVHPGKDVLERYPGAVLCRDLSVEHGGKRHTIRRGTPIETALAQLKPEQNEVDLHLLVPEEGDITQEEASQQLARAFSGDGLDPAEPHQGQVDVRSGVFGILRVDADAVMQANRTGNALIATALDGRVVEPGETVAIIKAPELLMASDAVQDVAAGLSSSPAIRVVPFARTRVALIAGDRIREANLKVSSKHLAAGLERYGADLVDVRKIRDETGVIAETYRELVDSGVELVLIAGSIVLDPEDPYLEALERVNATLVRRGAPIDPGTMFWVAMKDDLPFFGLASCEMYGRLSIIDLFLPYALADQPIDNALISRLGYGGLLIDTHEARKPASWRSGES